MRRVVGVGAFVAITLAAAVLTAAAHAVGGGFPPPRPAPLPLPLRPHPPPVLSREQLLSMVLGYDFEPGGTSSRSTSGTCVESWAPAS